MAFVDVSGALKTAGRTPRRVGGRGPYTPADPAYPGEIPGGNAGSYKARGSAGNERGDAKGQRASGAELSGQANISACLWD